MVSAWGAAPARTALTQLLGYERTIALAEFFSDRPTEEIMAVLGAVGVLQPPRLIYLVLVVAVVAAGWDAWREVGMAATTEVASSGSDVPNAMIVRPMIRSVN